LLSQIKSAGIGGLFRQAERLLNSSAKINRDYILPISKLLANGGSYRPTDAERKIAGIFMFSLQKILLKQDFKTDKMIIKRSDNFSFFPDYKLEIQFSTLKVCKQEILKT